MDFIDGLPISKGKSTILVVVDRLSKYAHLSTLVILTWLQGQISSPFLFFLFHAIPRMIVGDHDLTFTSLCWTKLFYLNRTDFNFSSTSHLQTNGRTEVVNKT